MKYAGRFGGAGYSLPCPRLPCPRLLVASLQRFVRPSPLAWDPEGSRPNTWPGAKNRRACRSRVPPCSLPERAKDFAFTTSRQEWAPAAACRPLAQPFFSLPAYPFRLWPDKLLPYGSLPVPGICRMGHALRQPAGSRSFPPYFLQPCAGSLTGSKRTSFILPLSSQI